MKPFATSYIWVHTSVYVGESTQAEFEKFRLLEFQSRSTSTFFTFFELWPQVPKNNSNQCLEFLTSNDGDFDVDLGHGVEQANERGFRNYKYSHHKECCIILSSLV